MKTFNIKAWPELIAYYPSMGRFERSAVSNNPIFLDFAGCKEISSTGLTVLLLRLLGYIKHGLNRRYYTSEPFEENDLLYDIRQLSFFHHLNQYANKFGLFSNELEYDGPFKPLQHYSFYDRSVTSFPIYCLNLNKYKNEERRAARFPFRKMLMEILSPYGNDYDFHTHQLISILTEILKNSADHTNSEAFFGIDIVKIPEKKSVTIHFVFGDLGCGIKNQIQNYVMPENIKEIRGAHLGLSEAYRYALKPGFSTSNSKDNKGIGMSVIREGSKNINMELSVFDAFSRGILTLINKTTHEDIRRYFHTFTKDQTQPFYYYGVITGESL